MSGDFERDAKFQSSEAQREWQEFEEGAEREGFGDDAQDFAEEEFQDWDDESVEEENSAEIPPGLVREERDDETEPEPIK